MEWWQVSALANGVVSLAYFAIAAAIFVPLSRAGELWGNRLGTATGFIFFTCAVGHGLHTVHALLPLVGVTGPEVDAGRSAEPHDALWAVLTATIGVYYWTLRRGYGRLLEGGTLFEDHLARQREAVEVNDGIVQSLVAARMARQLGREADVDRALEAALHSSRVLVDRLLQDASQGRPATPGDFVRSGAVGEPGP